MRTFVIPVRDLTASGEAFEFTVSRDWQLEAFAGSEIRPVGEGRIAVQASMSGRDVWVHGKVEVAAEGTCVRCLEPAQLALVGVLERMYVAPAVAPPRGKPRPARAKREEEEEEEEGEVPDDLDAYDGENVVLDEAVREQILLEVPMNPLCREDCPGLAADTEPAVRKGPFEKLSQIVLPKKE